MEAISNLKNRVKNWYQTLPDKKKYFELLTAVLSVPVLITVILLNLGNLSQNKKAQPTATPAASEKVTPIQIQIDTKASTAGSNLTGGACKQEIPPIEIVSPAEGQTVTDEPLCIDISYQKANYCAIVWSYRINGGSWSDYTDKDICLYNLSSGNKQLEVRVKSIASGEEILLKRNFIYKNPNPTPTVATSSASM